MSHLPTHDDIPPPVNVLGLPIRPLRTEGLIDLMVNRAQRGLQTTACYANAHTANLAMRDVSFARLLGQADVLYADGNSIVWASRWSERPLPERLTAADYFPRFAARCAEADLSLYLLGGRPGITEQAAERLRELVPGVRIAGGYHGFFHARDTADVVADINSARPDVLAIGMSSPVQERWLARHGGEIDVPVRWCVGALFDYLAGVERRAPAWLCNIGGEWLFRLMMDPLGKWRRYLIGNPRFVFSALRWGMRRRRQADHAGKVATAREA